MNGKQKKLHRKVRNILEVPIGYPHRRHHKNIKSKISDKQQSLEKIKNKTFKKNYHKIKTNLKNAELIN
jgi:hypothetical protein